jgi:hypothetical protein
MKIVLDECLPKRLASALPGHEVVTVQALGGAGLKNGVLLKHIAPRCEIFITVDRNMRHQQNLSACPFGVIVLLAPSNDIVDLLPLAPDVLSVLPDIQAGEVREMGPSHNPA